MNFNEAYELAKSSSKMLRRIYWNLSVYLRIQNGRMTMEVNDPQSQFISDSSLTLNNHDLSANDWEIVKVKVKKYQVLYFDYVGYFETSRERYKSKEEFLETLRPNSYKKFHSLIMDSEKEVDE